MPSKCNLATSVYVEKKTKQSGSIEFFKCSYQADFVLPNLSRKIKYVRPGAVFLFEEEESGILRWTDLFKWSPSRVSGSFLLYTALSDPPNSIAVDDTLIKQSFFSVDSSGARMHLIAYSSRSYRLGEGARHRVSNDPLICNLGLSEMNESISEASIPRVGFTSQCYVLAKTAPASNSILLPPMSKGSSTSAVNTPSSSLSKQSLTTIPPLTTTNLRASIQPSSIETNNLASSLSTILSSSRKRRPASPVQAIAIQIPSPLPRTLVAHSPTPSSSSFTSIVSQMALNLSRRPLTTSESKVSTSNSRSSSPTHSTTLFNNRRKFSSFTTYDSGSSNSRSRSLSPVTPSIASNSFSPAQAPSPQTPILPRSRTNSTTSTIGITNASQNRYQPYHSPRIASLSTSNLLSHTLITNGSSNIGGRSQSPRIVRRVSSFNDVELLNWNIREREESKQQEDFLGLRRKGSFLSPRRDPEDVRVLALLGKFSMTAF